MNKSKEQILREFISVLFYNHSDMEERKRDNRNLSSISPKDETLMGLLFGLIDEKNVKLAISEILNGSWHELPNNVKEDDDYPRIPF
jgi:hypothetical protein